MNYRKWLMRSTVVMVALFVSNSSLPALDSKANRATLKGLNGLGILVEYLTPEAEWGGLTKKRLQSDLEVRLQRAGMKVLTQADSHKAPGEPYLYVNVNVNTAKTEGEVYPYSIDVMLIQKTTLVRDPKQTVYAVTWSTGGVGSISKELLNDLRESVGDLVEVFIKACQAENRK